MLRPFVKIVIQQVPTEQWKERNLLIELDFAHGYEIESGWECHTDTMKVKLPKNIVVKSGKYLFQQRGIFNVILGGSGYVGQGYNIDPSENRNTNPPLIERGDIIYLQDGYIFKNEQRSDVQVGTTRFSGFISRVYSTIPIEFDCEDAFYLLKRTPMNKTVFSGKLLELCKYMLDQTNALFNAKNSHYPLLEMFGKPDDLTAEFTLGHLDIGTGLTCAQVLSQIRQQYKLESFFVDNKLRFGFPIYDEETANSKNFFEFQNNIFEGHSLEYKNKDDVILSAVVTCRVINKTGKKTKDGKDGTKKERKSVLVYWDVPTETFKFIEKDKGEPFPANEGGERHEFVYACAPTANPSAKDLFDYGVLHLQKYMYTGFRGSFTTFGYPFVRWGDNINLVDTVVGDRNGQYKVKKVIYRGGEGIEQEIFLDYRINIVMPNIDDAKSITMG